jgi:hypothetical protein
VGDRLLMDPALAPALHAAGVGSAAALLALGGDPDARHVVRVVDLPVEGTVGRFHLKRYAYDGWGRSKGLLGRGTLWGTAPELNEFRVLAALRENQIPAVRPVAAAARTQGGRLVAHALLTEHVPGAVDLMRRWLDPADPVRVSRRVRRRVMELIGRSVHRMHAWGHVHRDLYARNVLVRIEDDEPRIWLCDCRRGGPGRRLEGEDPAHRPARGARGLPRGGPGRRRRAGQGRGQAAEGAAARLGVGTVSVRGATFPPAC